MAMPPKTPRAKDLGTSPQVDTGGNTTVQTKQTNGVDMTQSPYLKTPEGRPQKTDPAHGYAVDEAGLDDAQARARERSDRALGDIAARSADRSVQDRALGYDATRNLATDPLRGQLNEDQSRTTQYSRAADAMNNRVYMDRGTIGRRTNSGFGSESTDFGGMTRFPGIETEETREMQRRRGVDTYQQQLDAARFGRAQDRGVNVQEQVDRATIDLAHRQGLTDLDIQQLVRTTNNYLFQRMPNEMDAQAWFQEFVNVMAKNKTIESANLLWRVYYTDPEFSNYISEALLHTDQPDLVNQALGRAKSRLRLYTNSEGDFIEQASNMDFMSAWLQSIAAFNGATAMLTNNKAPFDVNGGK